MLFNNTKPFSVKPAILKNHCPLFLTKEGEGLCLYYDPYKIKEGHVKAFAEEITPLLVEDGKPSNYNFVPATEENINKVASLKMNDVVLDSILEHMYTEGYRGFRHLPSYFAEFMVKYSWFFKAVSVSLELHDVMLRSNFSLETVEYLKMCSLYTTACALTDDTSETVKRNIASVVLDKILKGTHNPSMLYHLLNTSGTYVRYIYALTVEQTQEMMSKGECYE